MKHQLIEGLEPLIHWADTHSYMGVAGGICTYWYCINNIWPAGSDIDERLLKLWNAENGTIEASIRMAQALAPTQQYQLAGEIIRFRLTQA